MDDLVKLTGNFSNVENFVRKAKKYKLCYKSW